MITDVPALDGIAVHLLSQIDGDVQREPIAQQSTAAAIQAQAAQVAALFAGFVRSANSTLDICIYDFRLALPAISQMIVTAINEAADRGVTVRVAYDANEASDRRSSSSSAARAATRRRPAPRCSSPGRCTLGPDQGDRGGDGPRRGHRRADRARQPDHASQVHDRRRRRGRRGGVDGLDQLHGRRLGAAGEQHRRHRLSRISRHSYTKDFDELWTTEKLTGAGQGDEVVTVGGSRSNYAFAPGEGARSDPHRSGDHRRATARLRVASMVTSSPAILTALKEPDRRRASTSRASMTKARPRGCSPQWKSQPSAAAKVALAEAVLAKMVAKDSAALRPERDRRRPQLHARQDRRRR